MVRPNDQYLWQKAIIGAYDDWEVIGHLSSGHLVFFSPTAAQHSCGHSGNATLVQAYYITGKFHSSEQYGHSFLLPNDPSIIWSLPASLAPVTSASPQAPHPNDQYLGQFARLKSYLYTDWQCIGYTLLELVFYSQWADAAGIGSPGQYSYLNIWKSPNTGGHINGFGYISRTPQDPDITWLTSSSTSTPVAPAASQTANIFPLVVNEQESQDVQAALIRLGYVWAGIGAKVLTGYSPCVIEPNIHFGTLARSMNVSSISAAQSIYPPTLHLRIVDAKTFLAQYAIAPLQKSSLAPPPVVVQAAPQKYTSDPYASFLFPKGIKYLGKKGTLNSGFPVICLAHGLDDWKRDFVALWSFDGYQHYTGHSSKWLITSCMALTLIESIPITDFVESDAGYILSLAKDVTWQAPRVPATGTPVAVTFAVGDVVIVKENKNDSEWQHGKYANYVAPIRREVHPGLYDLVGISGTLFKKEWLEKTDKLPTKLDVAVSLLMKRGMSEKRAYQMVYTPIISSEEQDPLVLFSQAWQNKLKD